MVTHISVINNCGAHSVVQLMCLALFFPLMRYVMVKDWPIMLT